MVGAADGGGRWMVGLVARLLGAFVLSLFGSQKLVIVGAKISKEDLIFLGELMNAGKVMPETGVSPQSEALNEVIPPECACPERFVKGMVRPLI